MRWIWSHRPSPAMVVALIALVVATSGTAVAATGLVTGNSLIAKHTLSGNRLRNHTVTGLQIKALVWHPLTLENGWVWNGLGYGPAPQYAKDHQGFVHLRGTMDGSGQTSNVCATLPAGFIPPNGAWVTVGATNGVFDPHIVNLDIANDGSISVENGPGANDAFVSLDGVEFFAH